MIRKIAGVLLIIVAVYSVLFAIIALDMKDRNYKYHYTTTELLAHSAQNAGSFFFWMVVGISLMAAVLLAMLYGIHLVIDSEDDD